ncbi:MAG: hypothetical protein PHH04_06215 [Thomasclavelia sp.]|nr:hypothetical protein [Thomasclavelia sp.]
MKKIMKVFVAMLALATAFSFNSFNSVMATEDNGNNTEYDMCARVSNEIYNLYSNESSALRTYINSRSGTGSVDSAAPRGNGFSGIGQDVNDYLDTINYSNYGFRIYFTKTGKTTANLQIYVTYGKITDVNASLKGVKYDVVSNTYSYSNNVTFKTSTLNKIDYVVVNATGTTFSPFTPKLEDDKHTATIKDLDGNIVATIESVKGVLTIDPSTINEIAYPVDKAEDNTEYNFKGFEVQYSDGTVSDLNETIKISDDVTIVPVYEKVVTIPEYKATIQNVDGSLIKEVLSDNGAVYLDVDNLPTDVEYPSSLAQPNYEYTLVGYNFEYEDGQTNYYPLNKKSSNVEASSFIIDKAGQAIRIENNVVIAAVFEEKYVEPTTPSENAGTTGEITNDKDTNNVVINNTVNGSSSNESTNAISSNETKDIVSTGDNASNYLPALLMSSLVMITFLRKKFN